MAVGTKLEIVFRNTKKEDTVTQFEIEQLLSIRQNFLDALKAYEDKTEFLRNLLMRGAIQEDGAHSLRLEGKDSKLVIHVVGGNK
jgi:hypothetical protein